jgi:hypothetical protein
MLETASAGVLHSRDKMDVAGPAHAMQRDPEATATTTTRITSVCYVATAKWRLTRNA